MAQSTVLLYELACSGGLSSTRAEMVADDALIREGRAMLASLAADFAAIDGVETLVMRDARWTEMEFPGCKVLEIDSQAAEECVLREISGQATATMIVAPEIDGLLIERCEWVEQAGGRLISPSCKIATLATDKQWTAGHLQQHGVRAPQGVLLDRDELLPSDFKYPAVLKPIDGCASHDVWLVRDATDARCISVPRWAFPMRLEEFVPGIAASVAVLCGPNKLQPLTPCRQRLSNDGRFQYLGGSLPIAVGQTFPPAESRSPLLVDKNDFPTVGLAKRAQDLAVRAVATLPEPRGYLGVDLVLGDDPNGQDDVVIEINPRLTTSYLGLRAASNGNLAAAMWAIAEGRLAAVSFSDEPIEFDSDGVVRRINA
ncbi:MAG: ATP-grasp domain-containing protein [Pirellulales bacterium]|nr:ATP-grasp domain-containing protein [Pirellulales bacterium]